MMDAIEQRDKSLLGKDFIGSKRSHRGIPSSTKKRDKNGVLLYKIPYGEQWDYYPIFIARYGLGNLEMYLETGDNKFEDAFWSQVNWLYDNVVEKDGFAVWEHYYTLPFYDFDRIPWVHGLGQGLGMTALLKAYQLTNDKDYLEVSRKVLQSFAVDIKNGGVRSVDDQGNVWYEEYAIIPQPRILNGLITILFGMHEFFERTDDEQALALWNDGLATVKKNLARYDLGYWSRYDLLRGYPASENYHRMHVRQLDILYELSGDETFREYRNRWNNYMNGWMNRIRMPIQRGLVHLKRYGICGSMERYLQRRKWKRSGEGTK